MQATGTTHKLGDKVRDTITGLTGIVVCEARWLHGCRRLTIQPQELKDGAPVAFSTFDELQLELVEDRSAMFERLNPSSVQDKGGPGPEPRQHAAPTR